MKASFIDSLCGKYDYLDYNCDADWIKFPEIDKKDLFQRIKLLEEKVYAVAGLKVK